MDWILFWMMHFAQPELTKNQSARHTKKGRWKRGK
jgi:hypothetical protein